MGEQIPEDIFSYLERERTAINFTAHDTDFEIPWEGSSVRRFTAGNGRYDHVLHRNQHGFLVFLPGDEVLDELEEIGLPVERLYEPDENTRRYLRHTRLNVIEGASD